MELTYIDNEHIGVTCDGHKVVLRETVGQEGEIFWEVYTIGEHRPIDDVADGPCLQDAIHTFEEAMDAIPEMF